MHSDTKADGRMETKRLPGLLRRCVLSVTLLIALAHAPTSWADPKVKFNLPSDQVPKAILDFIYQSKVEVLFLSTDSLYKLRTQPVVGEFEPAQALGLMLKGTGLTFEFASDHSIVVKPPTAPAPTPPTRPTANAPVRATHLAAAPSSVLSDSGPPHSHGDGRAGTDSVSHVQGFFGCTVSNSSRHFVSVADYVSERASRRFVCK